MQDFTIDELKNLLTDCEKPCLVLLVGIPLSGKDTLISKVNNTLFSIISRDDILESQVDELKGYRSAYTSVDSKTVDKLFFNQINKFATEKASCIINATNLTKKRRRKICLRFQNYYKIAVILPLINEEEFNKRNLFRFEKTGKKLPPALFIEMTKLYETVTIDEEFNRIVRVSFTE